MILIIEKNDGIISVRKDKEVIPIETYELTKSIDFSKLMGVLLLDELSEKITWNVSEFEKSDEEANLINLLINIFETYNTKVDEFTEFLKDNPDVNNSEQK